MHEHARQSVPTESRTTRSPLAVLLVVVMLGGGLAGSAAQASAACGTVDRPAARGIAGFARAVRGLVTARHESPPRNRVQTEIGLCDSREPARHADLPAHADRPAPSQGLLDLPPPTRA